MTREQATQWHAALAMSAGALSGALARRTHSRRLLDSILSTLRPVMREMETDALQYQALENIEKGQNIDPPEKPKVPRVTRRVTR